VGCLDEDLIAAYFALKLSADETARLFGHVDTCAECARLFEAVVRARSVAPSATTDPSARTAPDLGKRPALEPIPSLGKYQVERVLGTGGMGVVYLARDPELDRRVAIKLLRPDARHHAGTLRAQLGREAQAMARLSHPNVINVYEIGAHGEQVFVVMELIDGTTLAAWLRERERSWREIVRAFVAAGEGLAAAHDAGVVHRDFKPDNVLISKDGRICVTDFGLARLDKSDDARRATGSDERGLDATMTYAGLLVGTPAYMAPEQMRGEATDARSDVFSFCVALYEALYGTRPYLGGKLDELRASIESGQIEPPQRVVGPGAYRRAIERGLQPRPVDRPASMRELLAVLRQDPIAQRRRRALTAAALMLALVVAGAFVQLRAARSSAPAPRRGWPESGTVRARSRSTAHSPRPVSPTPRRCGAPSRRRSIASRATGWRCAPRRARRRACAARSRRRCSIAACAASTIAWPRRARRSICSAPPPPA
jgi:serine/threonine protein kinase